MRRHNTALWEELWFRKLPPKYKLFVMYIYDKCDHVGIWRVDFNLASFFISGNGDLVEIFRNEFDDIVKQDDFPRVYFDNDSKLFMPKFLSLQYTQGINSGTVFFRSIKATLVKYNLIEYTKKILGDLFILFPEDAEDYPLHDMTVNSGVVFRTYEGLRNELRKSSEWLTLMSIKNDIVPELVLQYLDDYLDKKYRDPETPVQSLKMVKWGFARYLDCNKRRTMNLPTFGSLNKSEVSNKMDELIEHAKRLDNNESNGG